MVGIAVLGLAGFQAAIPAIGPPGFGAMGSAATAAELDSRTIPHPNWVQVSGEIEQTVRVRPEGKREQLVAMVKPVEGGHIAVDLGPAENLKAIHLENKDNIHVRGTPVNSGNTWIIVAGELYADGKVIPIRRDAGQDPRASGEAKLREER